MLLKGYGQEVHVEAVVVVGLLGLVCANKHHLQLGCVLACLLEVGQPENASMSAALHTAHTGHYVPLDQLRRGLAARWAAVRVEVQPNDLAAQARGVDA